MTSVLCSLLFVLLPCNVTQSSQMRRKSDDVNRGTSFSDAASYMLGLGSKRLGKGRLAGGGAALVSPAEHQHRSCLKQFHSPRGAK